MTFNTGKIPVNEKISTRSGKDLSDQAVGTRCSAPMRANGGAPAINDLCGIVVCGPSAAIVHHRKGVRKGGVEPPRPNGHRNLNPARLPIPPLSRVGEL